MKSNKTIDEIIAEAPATAVDISECIAFFADVLRWAEVEQLQPIRDTAWIAFKEVSRVGKREIALLEIKAQLTAYKTIYEVEPEPEPEPDPEPETETTTDTETEE